ncbi:ABC transporter ATP-binding protein [Achromobacter aloeverae]|uniref:ABC transporter ATP-binding protein n=1 Tax=Achromobacter aloeverae TaxID=1750518 RepID=UPI001EFF60BB|nr:ABC transporter ATP-binding protein [Achromobacter aloeverae]
MVKSDILLEVAGLTVRHGRVPALAGIDIELRKGEAVGLLGANGAGKTTLLNALSGFLPHESGRVILFGETMRSGAPHRIARAGLLQVSQDRDLFPDLSVRDNLRLGCLARAKSRHARNLERVFGYFPRLKERIDQRACTMSGGEQQMLAIGRALMAEPRVILLDEPSAGLSPLFVQEIGAMMQALKREGEVALVLVEQNMRLAARVVDRFYMLRAGQVVAQGVASELERDHEHLAREYYL